MPGSHSPAVVSVAAQQHGLVVLDETGEVLRPAKLWNDTESAPDADELVRRLAGGAAQWAESCGSVPLPSFTISKLMWLHRCEPDVLRRTASVLLPHDWLTFRLTGRRTTDRGDASGTGYWSAAEGRYRYDLLELVDQGVDWAPALPEVLAPAAVAGKWSGTSTLVAPGTGDNMAAALGLGLRPGDLALSLGTSGTAFTVGEEPSADPTGTVAGFADATGRYLPLVCTMNATKVTDAVARLLGLRSRWPRPPGPRGPDRCRRPGAGPSLRRRADPEPARRDGHPLWTAERRHPGAAGARRMEGVVCNLLAGADALGSLTGRVFLVGGAARSPAYRRVVADLTGREVVIPAERELVATGAAVQAAAVHLDSDFAQVGEAWDLGQGEAEEPDVTVDRAAVRDAYAAAGATAEP